MDRCSAGQCKAKTRSFDARIEDISALVRTAVHDQGFVASGGLQSNAPIQNAIETARSVSRDLNQQVVQVVKEQTLPTLRSTPASHVAIDAAEHEPNDDILNANEIELGKLVKAAIAAPTDVDFYTFTTPKTYRDWIRIEVQNQYDT